MRCEGLSYLEDVKALILHHLPLVPQQIHAQLQMLPLIHILHHDAVIRPIQEQLAQQLDALPLRHIALALDQHVIVPTKKELEIVIQVIRHQALVPRQQLAEGGKRIRAGLEGGIVDPGEEAPEHAGARLRLLEHDAVDRHRGAALLTTSTTTAAAAALIVQHHRRDVLDFQYLPQHGPARHGGLAVLVPAAQRDDDFGPDVDDVGEGEGVLVGGAGGAEAERVGEDGLGVLAGFEAEQVDAPGEFVEEVVGDHVGDEGVDGVGGGVGFWKGAEGRSVVLGEALGGRGIKGSSKGSSREERGRFYIP